MANGDFISKHTGEEIERILDGSVVYNEYQKLSEIQKAQARRNIGAGTVDSGLVIKGYYATYEELIAAQTNPQVSDAYGVGVQAPYNIFVWDSLNRDWVDNGTITKGERGERGEDGKDGESPTAENIAAALGYTPAANDLSNVADGGVTRAKLASDVLYSPVVRKRANYAITANDIGTTFVCDTSSSTDIVTLTLDVGASDDMPVGSEIAVLAGGTPPHVLVTVSGLKVRGNIDGTSYANAGTNTCTFTISKWNMIALKKIYEQYWLITGVCEVVE